MKVCSKCARKIDFEIVGNLCFCNSCGYVLLDDKKSQFNIVPTDLRKLTLSWESGWVKVTSTVYQLDLLKFINMSQHSGCHRYADWFRKVILQMDKAEKRDTDFNRLEKLPRVFLRDHLDKKE